MRAALLFLGMLVCTLPLLGVGTRKAQRIYIRREVVSSAQAAAPFEHHDYHTGRHVLYCRAPARAAWGWKRRPTMISASPNYDSLQRMINRLIADRTSQSTYEVGNVGFYYRRFANGFEALILEGPGVHEEINRWIDESERRSGPPESIRAVMR